MTIKEDIEATAKVAVAFADGKKAAMKKAAAGKAKEAYENTKKEANTAAASLAKLKSKLSYK